MRYIPNSPDEREEMLRAVGLKSADELFTSVPAELLLQKPMQLPAAASEMELLARFEEMAHKNAGARRPSFLGAGAYAHYAPTIVDHLISRSEFFTAYTPYQPEISQGTLQAIFEFQTLVCQLTAMEVANASMYDGSTSVAEAVLMAERVTRRSRVLVSAGVHPEYLEVVRTYVQHAGIEVAELAVQQASGQTETRSEVLDETVGAVIVQSPNFFGVLENLQALADEAHRVGALLIVAITEPVSLGVVRPPGACGADIVVAEGQSLGVPLSYGGPYVGLFATREKYARQMPGRLVGQAVDKDGRRGFVLTLATREQHIRREKATSNICTNQGLIALAASIYMTTMGRRGMQETAHQCAQKAAYAAKRISALDGFALPHSAPTFNEFTVRAPVPAAELLQRVSEQSGIAGGVALARYYPDRAHDFLVCVTEVNSRAQIDALVEALARAASSGATSDAPEAREALTV